jgi:hypothetical protein
MKLVSILILTVCTAGSALAQSDVTWVASNGTNNVNCFRTTPCATFAQALAATNANGVIKTVDAAEYGVVSITRNVTIDCNGGGGGATIAAGAAIGITINNPGGQVTIRNLTIDSSSGGGTSVGILILGGDVHLENVLIVGTPNDGVFANGSSANPIHLTTKNVTVLNAGSVGIFLLGASGSLRDSVIRGGNTGLAVESATGQAAVALVERCELSYNVLGLFADNTHGAGGTVRVSDTVITGNTTGISASNGAQIISFRTNMLAGNTTDGTTLFSVSLK